jgi:hypothetical protein
MIITFRSIVKRKETRKKTQIQKKNSLRFNELVDYI